VERSEYDQEGMSRNENEVTRYRSLANMLGLCGRPKGVDVMVVAP
jgi:hypothetical protein